MRLGSIISLGILLGGTIYLPLAQAADTSQQARTMLNKMSLAVRHLNYEGTFVYVRGTNIVSMRIVHGDNGQGVQERLQSLSGPATEVIRNGKEIKCIFPRGRTVLLDKASTGQLFGSTLPQPVEKVGSYYTFSVLGGDRVADRPTWVVAIQSKSDDRYGYRLWVDNSTYLLLKSEVVETNGTVLEQVLFTDIKVTPSIPDSDLKPSVRGQTYTHRTDNADKHHIKNSADATWQVQWLPAGFEMENQNVHPIVPNGNPTNHMVFSDGLASVSVFTEKLEQDTDRMEGLSSFGALHTYSTMMEGHQVTVVGEVPPATLQQIAGSVSYNKDNNTETSMLKDAASPSVP
jgi:sigma-E factor negative regulatory protein RseB